MNESRVGLLLTLKETGIANPRMQTFSERFNVQKRLYLIQVCGLDLGYRFSWYLRGPYCRALTDDAFTLRDELAAGETDYQGYQLGDAARAAVGRAMDLWAVPAGECVDPDKWLELLASLHYLKHIAYWPGDGSRDFDAVFDSLITSKPQFTGAKPLAFEAWQRLDEMGLVDNKTLA